MRALADMKKVVAMLLNALPVLAMIALIPLEANDYKLAFAYVLIIIFSFTVRRESKDFSVFAFGFFIMIACEYLFVSTGVETFARNSLFGLMPLWLPLLWGYGFVAIKRGIEIIK